MCKALTYGYVRVSTVKQSIERQIENIKSVYPDAIIRVDKCTGTKLDRPEWNKLVGTAIRGNEVIGTYPAKKRVRNKETNKLETVFVDMPIYNIIGFEGGTIRKGDTIVFDEISRMSRNAEDGFATYKYLYGKGVNLIFLKESALNTENFRNSVEQIATTGNWIADEYIETTNKVLMKLAENQIKASFAVAEHEAEFLHMRTAEGIREAAANGKQIGMAEGKKLTTKKSIKAKEEILKYSKDFNGTLEDKDVMKLTGLARNTYYKYKRELKAEA